MLRTFAASAATAVALAQSVQSRSAAQLAGRRRRRAPALGARAARRDAAGSRRAARCCSPRRCAATIPERRAAAMREAVGHIEREIANLRAIITELRPAALDELGLRDRDRGAARPPPRTERVRDRGRARAAGSVARDEARLDERARDGRLPAGAGGADERRQARRARSSVRVERRARPSGELLIEVQDDGAGFDPERSSDGFGLAGHARARGPGGRHARASIRLRSERGTRSCRACLPRRRRRERGRSCQAPSRPRRSA